MLEIAASHCCMKFQGKLMIQTQEKPQLGPDLGPLSPHSSHQFFFFFFKNLTLSVTRYYGQLSLWTMLEKTNDPTLRKLCDRWTDRPDGWEWFHSKLDNWCRVSKMEIKDLSVFCLPSPKYMKGSHKTNYLIISTQSYLKNIVILEKGVVW